MPSTLILVLLLLGATVVLEAAAERFSVPRPCMLLLGGLLIACLPGTPRLDISPDVLFVLFIPPLLFWAAFNSSVRDLQANALAISLSGVALVLLTVAAVAWTIHALIPSVTWPAAVTLGAIIAPPDVVVTMSMLRGLCLPRSVTTILLGESLINDAASLVVYRIAIGSAVAGTFSWFHGLTETLAVVLGGALCGLAVGWLTGLLRQYAGGTPVLQVTITLLVPFAAYLPADLAHVSGVISVVVAGVYLGRTVPLTTAAETRIEGRGVWGVLTFLLEGLTFLLIGLDLPYARDALADYSLSRLLGYAFIISGVIAVVRLLCAFPIANLPRWVQRKTYRPVPPWRNVVFVGWAGLRGGDSLIVALTLPVAATGGAPFPSRNLIIVLTFGVVLISILLAGFSLRPLVTLLRLRDDGLSNTEERQARHLVAEAGLNALDSISTSGTSDADAAVTRGVIDFLREVHASEPVSSSLSTRSLAPPANLAWVKSYHDIRSQMVRAEGDEVVHLRDEAVINDEVMYRLLRVNDLEEVLLATQTDAAALHEARFTKS